MPTLHRESRVFGKRTRSSPSFAGAVVTWLLAATFGCVAPSLGQSATATEEALKGAFLYNFAKFVDWPSGTVGEDALVLCVSDEPFASTLRKGLEGKPVQSRALAIRYWAPEDEPSDCNMLFVESLDREERIELLESLQGLSILTVGAAENFARDGGIINLIQVEDRLGFQVNPAAADRANLRISSKLMRLAEVVDE